MMFRIPPVTKNLLIINLIAFLATLVFQLRGIDLADIGGLHFFMASNFHVYQLVTYLFLHASFMHILSNMFGLWMFGCVIENVWGPKKFLFYYITCGIGAGILQEIAQFGSFYMTVAEQVPQTTLGTVIEYGTHYASALNAWTTIGASGAVYAVILAFGMTFPNERLFIIPFPFPIKAKWFVLELEDMTPIFTETLEVDPTMSWHEHTCDLSAYAGKTVKLAFRHHDCVGQYLLKIDDAFVYTMEKWNGITTDINAKSTSNDVVRREYFNAAGQRVERPVNGINVVRQTMKDGSVKSVKFMMR